MFNSNNREDTDYGKEYKKYIQDFIIVRYFVDYRCLFGQFLQTDSPNQPSQSTYWQTESDALMALTACYDAMQSRNLYDDNIDGWNYGFLCRETCTDNGDHTWETGCWEVQFPNVRHLQRTNVFQCTGMLIMK